MDKNVLGDLKYLTKFSHTEILEIFHPVHNKWIPKRQHFSHLGIVTRSQSAIMDFNSGSDLPQAKTRRVQGKYNFGYSQITKRWSSKAMKVKKDKTHYFEIIEKTAEGIKNKIQLPLPELPKNLTKNIAPS